MQVQLTQEQRVEVTKILEYLKRMEPIIQTSPNPEQKSRVGKDIAQYKSKLEQLLPKVDLKDKNLAAILSVVGPLATPENEEPPPPHAKKGIEGEILSRIQVKKASSHCNHSEVNLISTVLNMIDQIYWPVLDKSYFKVDYQHVPRRNALQLKLENVLRSVKSFIEIMEDEFAGQRAEPQKRLAEIKSHSTRKLLMEGDTFIKSMHSFLSILLDDIKIKDNLQIVIQQKVEDIQFKYPSLSKEFPTTGWEKKTIKEVISELREICSELTRYLSLPSIKDSTIEGP